MFIFTSCRTFRPLIIVIGLLLSIGTRAQQPHYNFYNHSTDNGLLTNDYQKIYYDSYGYIWLASFDGLFRWDGYTLKKYVHQEKDTLSLNNNIVYSIFEDSQRRLWVGTIDGLNLYDAAHDNFRRMPLNGRKDKTPVNAILEDDAHQLWLGTSNGICRYDALGRHSEWFRVKGDDDNIIFCLALDQHHTLWAGTYNKGVIQFNTDTHTFRLFRNVPGQPSPLASNKIQSILVDDEQRIWIGTEDRGVNIWDNSGRPLAAFDNLSHSNQFTHSNTRCLYQDSHGTIWIGLGREVVCAVKKGSLQPVAITTRSQNNGQERLNSITSIAEDTFGNIWFASSGYGLFTTNSRKNVFNNLLTSTAALPGLNTTVVAALYEDAQRRLWVGTAGSGVLMLDPARPDNFNTTPLSGTLAVNDVKGDTDGLIWVACWTSGLKSYDPATGRQFTYVHDPQDPNSLINNDVKTILPDDSIVWIGTQGDGISVFHKKTKQFIHYKNNHTYPFNMQAPGWVNHLFKDRQHRLWISSYSGLFLYDGKAMYAYEHNEKANSINSNSVNMVAEDNQGRIWVITEQGLDRFDAATQTFVHLNKQLSLPESMKSIVCDATGNLWIGTNEGLIKLNPATLKVSHYDKNDGLFERTFFQKSVWRGHDGTLYFGGPKGLSAFNPARMVPEQTPSYFYFTDLTIFGDVQQPGQPGSALHRILNLTDTVTLTQKQSFFSIGFAAINLYAPHKIKYSYRLEGYYDDWIEVVDERKISFAHLQPGIYHLQVRYTDIYGEWQPPHKSLVIEILPYWWQTWWFRIALLGLLIAAIACIFYWRVSAVKKRNRLLTEEVRRQTARLRETNTSLMEQHDNVRLQKEKLESSYTEIVRQTDKILVQQQQISSQNNALEQAVAQLEKLNASKDYFFSVLAHDLKNPVASLKELSGYLQDHMGKIDLRTLQQYIANMHTSSSMVFELLVNLLSWSMSQSRNIQLAPVDTNLAAIIHSNLQLLQPQLRNKHITVQMQVADQLWIHADQQMMDVAIRNILSNSVKFTDYNGEIRISATVSNDEVALIIADNGIGMTAAQVDALFHIDKTEVNTGTAGEKGTGLGLLIVHDFLQANHAGIQVQSEPGKGTAFTLTLPAAAAPPALPPVPATPAEKEITGQFWQSLPTDKFLKIKGKKILIVEDSKETRDYMRLLLSDVFEIFEAANGQEGFDTAREAMPSLIITDLLMPGMNGLQFCREIKSHTATSHIPVVILTSQWQENMQASGYEAGAEAYLTKPVKPEVLMQVLLNFLQKQDTIYQRVREQIFNDTPLPQDSSMLTDVDQQFLQDLIKFIEENMANQELDAKLISKALCVSRTVLYHKVKSLTEQTVHEFIKAIRLRKSVHLLLEGNLNINQVAFEVGFNSHSYFDKCFIKQYGTGPREYIARKKAGH
ncbi:Signal transduction histidine kinase [Chitinophaga costaii]|uniref:histidine kinase n=1 Tax=Chitinophaga costaii TaxID=1335309 RepID=A0A1C4EZY8_9BACT|nr:two-component regulator propeller domain-containing protein [Chitinophaga costaii]PUZ21498.1 hypothetical protein DCM91_15790 [Chitinophaga costaii]SCC49204.1 Signal transduction histidine kinase [Chitinophaga costaii]